uniref:Uncharacterized protein n=2 Tax=Ditylenchus dipsaci TaxID=166011 RepID=A0A915EAE0_9BILA
MNVWVCKTTKYVQQNFADPVILSHSDALDDVYYKERKKNEKQSQLTDFFHYVLRPAEQDDENGYVSDKSLELDWNDELNAPNPEFHAFDLNLSHPDPEEGGQLLGGPHRERHGVADEQLLRNCWFDLHQPRSSHNMSTNLPEILELARLYLRSLLPIEEFCDEGQGVYRHSFA